MPSEQASGVRQPGAGLHGPGAGVQSPGAGDKDRRGDTVMVTSMFPAPGVLVLGCLAMRGHKEPGVSTSWRAMAYSLHSVQGSRKWSG